MAEGCSRAAVFRLACVGVSILLAINDYLGHGPIERIWHIFPTWLPQFASPPSGLVQGPRHAPAPQVESAASTTLTTSVVHGVHVTTTAPTTSVMHGVEVTSASPTPVMHDIAVFFHIYQANTTRAAAIVAEQLRAILAYRTLLSGVFYTTVGGASDQTYDCPMCSKVQHKKRGGEELTLQLLFDHCLERRSESVAYVHTKGSYHATHLNTLFRRMLMRGAFSEQCLRMPKACNVCAARFSPMPHQHMPGNIFIAKCSYVRRLLPPEGFASDMYRVMQQFQLERKNMQPSEILNIMADDDQAGRAAESTQWKFGLGRFAPEHWIASHPSVQPCDTYAGQYLYAYDHIPTHGFEPSLSIGPRFPLQWYFVSPKHQIALWSWRRFEWRVLYNGSVPSVDGWASAYYNSTNGHR